MQGNAIALSFWKANYGVSQPTCTHKTWLFWGISTLLSNTVAEVLGSKTEKASAHKPKISTGPPFFPQKLRCTRSRSPRSPAPMEITKKIFVSRSWPPHPLTFKCKCGFEKQNRIGNLNNQNKTAAEFYTKLKSGFFILRCRDLQTTSARSEHKLPTALCLLPPSRKSKTHSSNPRLPAEPLQAQLLPKPTVLCGISEVSLTLQARLHTSPISTAALFSLLILNLPRGIQLFLPRSQCSPPCHTAHAACP